MTSTVIPLRTKAVPQDFASLQSRTECYQKVWREWGSVLDPNEQIIVLQIIDRTIGWGRREAYFSARAVLKGDAVYSGLKMHRATFYRALARLEERGIVQRRHDPVKLDRVHFTVNMDWNPAVVNLPKRLQKRADPVAESDYPVAQSDTPVAECDTIASNHLLVSTPSNQAGATAPLPSPAETVRARAQGAAAAHRATLAGKATKPQAAVDAVDAAWRLALIDTFPGTAYRSWGVREKAQVKTVLRTWRGDCSLPEFVTWAVTNWAAIIRKQFKWMTKVPPPSTPALSFFIAFLNQFADCRAEGVLESWLSADDRTQLERMMGRGLTYEQATAELAKDKVAVALRSEMEKREIAVRARDYGATRKLAAAKALADLEGRVPIHPNSPNARKLIEEQRRAARPEPTRVLDPDGDEFQGAEVYFVDPTRNPFDD